MYQAGSFAAWADSVQVTAAVDVLCLSTWYLQFLTWDSESAVGPTDRICCSHGDEDLQVRTLAAGLVVGEQAACPQDCVSAGL